MVQIWDAAAGTQLVTCQGLTHEVNVVVWSSDGKCIASGSYSVKLWQAV
jgi:WD40 repeat protein